MLNLSIAQINEKLKNKAIRASEIFELTQKKTQKYEDSTGAFLAMPNDGKKKAEGIDKLIEKNHDIHLLAGIPFSVKDNISAADMPMTCGSEMLCDYTPSFDASVVARIKEKQGILKGKTNLNEFGIGGGTETSAFHQTYHPLEQGKEKDSTKEIAGGGAAALASGQVLFALESDVSGEMRMDALKCGLTALKPSYPTVSKHGLVSYAPSLDQIGIIARSAVDCGEVWQSLPGKDEFDMSVRNHPAPNGPWDGEVKSLRIGIPSEVLQNKIGEGAKEIVLKTAVDLEKMGADIEECSLPHLKESSAISYIISSAEASSSLARFDGVRFGKRNIEAKDILTMYMKTRGEGFGEKVKKRIVAGTLFLSTDGYESYYEYAAKIRSLLIHDFKQALMSYDCLLMPVSFLNRDEVDEREKNAACAAVNLIGLPTVSFPCCLTQDAPAGVQLVGKMFDERTIVKIANRYQKEIDWKTRKKGTEPV